MKKLVYVLVVFAVVFNLTSCGPAPTKITEPTTPPPSPTNPSPTNPTSIPAQIALSASSASVKSDNSTSSDVTATVLDADNAVVADATVVFSVSGGQISSASGVTDANGDAIVTFKAGVKKVNQVATLTATLAGVTPAVSAQIPIKIVGSVVALTPSNTNLATGGAADTLVVSVVDAGGVAIQNIPVTVAQSGAGSVNITTSASVTDANGNITVNVSGATAGQATVTVTAAGASASQVYTVTTVGVVFAIVNPAADPFAIGTNTNLPVSVTVPAGIANVTFATSLGSWVGAPIATPKLITVPVAAGSATATLISSQSGLATVQAFDALVPATSDSMKVAFSQPATAAAQITLQSNAYVVQPSLAGASNSVTLTAVVRTAAPGAQAVGGAAVLFSIPNPTGGGEFVSPVVAVTDSSGVATATFTSGSTSTGGQGINVQAELVNNPAALPATAKIVIGGTAGSVVIGRGSKIIVPNATEYIQPMSVLVADGNGNGVQGATVTLKAFPSFFSIGYWFDIDPSLTSDKFVPCVLGTFTNEDINRNALLDPGEDVPHTTLATSCDIYAQPTVGVGVPHPANSQIDAPNSAAGSLPSTVTTDINGVANFDLVYLKGSAVWIDDEITASTTALGTETTSSITFTLPYEKAEGESGSLPASVFGQ